MKLLWNNQVRQKVGIFILGMMVPILFFAWCRFPLAILAVESLAIVNEDFDHITISYPHRTVYNDAEYRIRIPKYNYPAYHANVTIWHQHGRRPAPPIEEAWPVSLSDY